MKILIEQKTLAEMLAVTARAASKTDLVPTLMGVHMEAKNGTLTLAANNFEMAVKTSTTEVEIVEEGEVLSNAQYLANFIAKLDTSPISLEVGKTSKLAIKYGKNKGNINTLNKEEWVNPQFNGEGFSEKFTVKSGDLKKALDAVIFAAANDHFRKVFTGVLFDVKDGMVNLVASDTHKLAWYAIKDVENAKEGQFIAPTKYLKETLRMLRDTDDPVTVSTNDNVLVLATAETAMSVRLLEGQYPNYHSIMPATSHSMSMATEKLKSSLGRIRSLPQDDKTKLPAAKFLVNGNGEIKVEYTSDIAGAITEIIALEESSSLDEEMTIILNASYMQEIAKSVGIKTQVSFSGPMSPILITSDEDAAKYVLVPMR